MTRNLHGIGTIAETEREIAEIVAEMRMRGLTLPPGLEEILNRITTEEIDIAVDGYQAAAEQSMVWLRERQPSVTQA